MDLVVLQRLAPELDERLRGRRIAQVWALPKNDVVIAVERRSGARLWFSSEPEQPHLYLRDGGHATPDRPPGFAMAARNLLVGRRIRACRWVRGDRIIELLCAGDDAARVVFELIPRRATALVLDGAGQIMAAWQPRRGRPAVGDLYQPPSADRRAALQDLADSAWSDLTALPDDDALVRGLLRSVAGMSPLVAREAAWRHRGGTPLPEAVREEMRRAAEEPTAARIYAPQPLDDLATLPPARHFVLSPYVLHHLETNGAPSGHEFPTVCDAAAAFYPLRTRLSALQAARNELVAALDLGVARLRRTADAVADDAAGAGDPERHRRWADLLLAYPQAPRDGSVVRVPDPYTETTDGAAAEADIPIDPARSRIDNAQAYYNRARRAERSAARTAARRQRLQRGIEALGDLLQQARASRTLADCVHIARAARAHGVRLTTEKWQRPESTAVATEEARAPAASSTSGAAANDAAATTRRRGRGERRIAGVDTYTSSDGHEILVGRSAQGNEKVTHKLAAPHDFWLHAEGPGSHVVIRNPGRAAAPSDDALREAAALAAWFSRARGATKVNVRWTQARHVKKPRGAPAGQVVLRASHTVLAEPLPPQQLLRHDDDEKRTPRRGGAKGLVDDFRRCARADSAGGVVLVAAGVVGRRLLVGDLRRGGRLVERHRIGAR